MKDFETHLQKNLQSWEERTPVHLRSKFYNNDLFLETKNSLNNIEIQSLGNVTNQSLLHLQCHFGQDTLSWAQLGAEVTGIDFSPSAIVAANELAKQTQLVASFV